MMNIELFTNATEQNPLYLIGEFKILMKGSDNHIATYSVPYQATSNDIKNELNKMDRKAFKKIKGLERDQDYDMSEVLFPDQKFDYQKGFIVSEIAGKQLGAYLADIKKIRKDEYNLLSIHF